MGMGDVQTVCYYLLCLWSEPQYLTTHSPSVSHSHFSLPVGLLSYRIGLCDSLVRHLKPPMVIEGTLHFRIYSSNSKCLYVPWEKTRSVNVWIKLVVLGQQISREEKCLVCLFSLLDLMFQAFKRHFLKMQLLIYRCDLGLDKKTEAENSCLKLLTALTV